MLVERMRPFSSTIFTEISRLAEEKGAINLGQGFPDTDGPASLLADAAANITARGLNQYPPGPGVPALRAAVAEHQLRFYGLAVDPSDVVVTTGATEAITASLLGLCGPGDEVVAFEPTYDSYAAAVALAGATLRTVPLIPPTFEFDEDALAAAFSERTRVVLVNTPHNPTGAVLTAAELARIGELAVAHDAVIVTDEVYEHMVFDGGEHVPVATLPGLADRTLTISSGGKTFSVTGWKVGWVHGPPELVAAPRTVKQFLTFHGGAPLQPAVAGALGLGNDFYAGLPTALERKRDLLAAGLVAAGFDVLTPSGTYFILADPRPLGFDDGVELAWKLPERCGVAAVPVSVFCHSPGAVDAYRPLLRFAFCKRDAVLSEASERLARVRA